MIKTVFSILTILTLLVACNNKQEKVETNTTTGNTTKTSNDTTNKTATTVANPTPINPTTWIDDFRIMRDAFYNKQKDVMAGYFSFPITTHSEHFWSWSGTNEDPRKPFTKADFDKYCTNIFDAEFVTALNKIKTDELFNKGTYTTPTLTGKDSEFDIETSYDKKMNQLVISYHNKASNGQGEAILRLTFDIKDNKLKYNKIEVEGS
jgi:hypothetical protein